MSFRWRWSLSGQSKKYGNKKVKFDGFTFDSDVEFQRYLLLKEKHRTGEITEFVVKPGFLLKVNGVRIFERAFRPDFRYRENGTQIVEDVKGYMDDGDAATKMFRVKCNLVKALYGVDIHIVQTPQAVRSQERRREKQKLKRRRARGTARTRTPKTA